MGNSFCSNCQRNASKRRNVLTSEYSSGYENEHEFDGGIGTTSSSVNSIRSSDEWHDALQEFQEEEETSFFVSAAELMSVRKLLKASFPQDSNYMDDDYIISVASKPYSKDMTRRRPLEYSMEKLLRVMEWRKEHGVPQLPDLVALANLSVDDQIKFKSLKKNTTTTNSNVSNERLAKAKAMVATLNNGSLYWHGLTIDGRPILWLRAQRLPWFPDADAQINALIMLADVGIQSGMPPGVTEFVAICHCAKSPPPHPKFAFRLLNALTKGFPDRLHVLWSAPVSSIVDTFMNVVSPLMPARLSKKLAFLDMNHCQERLVHELLLNGLEDLPTFFGGPNEDHDKFYPEEKYCPNRGEGSLKFDFYGMKERLIQQRRLFEERLQ